MSHPTKVFDHAMVLDMRDSTLQEIGDLFGVTRERIRQIEKKYGVTRGQGRITVGTSGKVWRVAERHGSRGCLLECLACGNIAASAHCARHTLDNRPCRVCTPRRRPGKTPTTIAEGSRFGDWETLETVAGLNQDVPCVCRGCGTRKPVCAANLAYGRTFRCIQCAIKRRDGKPLPLELTTEN